MHGLDAFLAGVLRGFEVQLPAFHADPAGVLPVDPGHAADHGGLAGAVVADQGGDLALPQGEDVDQGADGAWYIRELTGFPFPAGGARVYRLVPGHQPKVYATGFTTIIDLAWGPDRRLYVLEIARVGLLSGDRTGALLRVSKHGPHQVLASTGLQAPGGRAIRGRSAYISNCSTCKGTGSVVRVALG